MSLFGVRCRFDTELIGVLQRLFRKEGTITSRAIVPLQKLLQRWIPFDLISDPIRAEI
jgi:hypothetical protein